MQLVLVENKKEEKIFLDFRKKLYKNSKQYIDNNYFMIKEVFNKKTSFINGKDIYPINIKNDGKVICQGIVVYASDLPEYIQLCFFESLPEQAQAVKMLLEEAIKIGKLKKCKKIVVGLNGHVDYGLGLLNSHFDKVNSFSGSANPKYYNDYFKRLNFSEIKMNSYIINSIDNRLDKYRKLIEKLDKTYTYKNFDKKNFDYYSKIYTDLNNKTFNKHRYYYPRNYKEDKEMLKELFLFMKEDSLIFAFQNDKPVGFIMWYPDFNELGKKGDIFGVKHFIKNIVFNKKIKTAKIMEYGILDQNRQFGLPLGLINQIFINMKNYNISKVESSWILDENKDSNSVCEALCDSKYKEYVSYEKDI